MTNSVTRRDFLSLLGAYGGTSALLQAGTALGLMPQPGQAAPPSLLNVEPGSRRVAVLGAGLSGLATAWELTRAGYDCTILEASHRPGGRVFTVRSGTVIDEIGNYQRCEFDDEPHLYFNAGAARIPSNHSTVLGYCKELGVDLEIFVNESMRAWVQDDNFNGGKPVRNADFHTNMHGFLAEMLAKSLKEGEMDEELSEGEMETLLGIIRSFGDLNEDMLYEGSFRAGYASGGFLDHGTRHAMIAFRELLKSRLAAGLMVTTDPGTGAGPVLMQPVGGMDRIPYAFANRLADKIRFGAAVKSVQIRDDGVDIAYQRNGQRESLQADYCFNCIPSHLMTGIPNNLPADYLNALKYIRRGEAYKAAFQARHRFWEDEGVYAGITWVNSPIQQIWYPPHGIHKQKGVILAAYDFGGGMYYTKMTQQQRIEELLKHGEKVHPGYREMVEKPITIAWHRMNNMLGCAARWQRNRSGWTSEEETMYHTLQQPANGRHWMIGDQISQHAAWMESAFQSAHHALADFDQRVRAAV